MTPSTSSPPPTGCRIGIYGGAFDPPHHAHVALARAAVAQVGLTRLYVVPTGQPWMKQRRLADGQHRLAMAQQAFATVAHTLVSDCEVRRAGVTYTIDTLHQLQAEVAAQTAGVPQPCTWFLLMGQDLLASLPQWQRAEELFAAVTVAVLQRPAPQPLSGQARYDVASTLAQVQQVLPTLRATVLQLPASATSSTHIRQIVRACQSQPVCLRRLAPLVPPAVAQYIARHRLYLTDSFSDAPDLMPTEHAPASPLAASTQARPAPATDSAAPQTHQALPDVATKAGSRDIQKLQRAIVDGLEDVKAQDIRVFNTEHLSPLFERVIIASGSSNRQTRALAVSVRDAVRDAGFAKPRTEGEDNGEWIIVDCGAAVVHVMQPAIRQYYMLEDIWGDKPVRMRIGKAAQSPRTPAKAAASGTTAKASSRRAAKPAAQPPRTAAPSKTARSQPDEA